MDLLFSLDSTGLSSQVGDIFTQFGPIIILVGGIGLAFAAVPKVMGWIKKGAK